MKYSAKRIHLELFSRDCMTHLKYIVYKKTLYMLLVFVHTRQCSAGKYSYTRHPPETLTEQQGLLFNSLGTWLDDPAMLKLPNSPLYHLPGSCCGLRCPREGLQGLKTAGEE